MKHAIQKFSDNPSDYDKHLLKMESNYQHWNKTFPQCSVDQSKAHVLSLSYYTGVESERVNRNTNVIIKAQNSLINLAEVGLDKEIYPIIYFLVKTLS